MLDLDQLIIPASIRSAAISNCYIADDVFKFSVLLFETPASLGREMSLRQLALIVACALGFPTAAALAQDFNAYILKSIEHLYPQYANGGYDISSVFTHDIDYGGKGTIKATSPRKTMCVAAVTEVIIQAIKLYADATGDRSVFGTVPLTAWTKGNVLSLRANIFMYAGTGSRGTGHTVSEFGLGEELRFQDLQPGDFVNLNRTNNTGHAVVFLGYLQRDLSVTESYGSDVVGFRYFSAQGKGKPDAGFAYRYGFFDGICPASSPVPRDCGIIRSNSRALLNAGRMWDPGRWAYQQAVTRRKLQARSALEDQNPEASRGTIDLLLDQEIQKELQWSPDQAKTFENETTD